MDCIPSLEIQQPVAPIVGADGQTIDDTRGAVRHVMAEEGLTQAEVSRESGVKPSILSQWLAGKYPGDADAVGRALRVWLNARGLRVEAAQQLVAAPEYFETPTSRRILDALFWAQFTADIAVIHGGAGVGKTTSIKKYQSENPSVWVVTIAPDTAGVIPMLEEVCETIGLTEARGGARRMAREIKKKIRESRGLLIVDEAQHLTIQSLEQLRAIHDACGIGLAFLGNDNVYARLNGGGARAAQFAQLYSRIGIRQKHNRPKAGDVYALARAWKIEDEGVTRWLQTTARKPGALRGITKVLKLAATRAGGTPLTVETLTATWRQLTGEEGQ